MNPSYIGHHKHILKTVLVLLSLCLISALAMSCQSKEERIFSTFSTPLTNCDKVDELIEAGANVNAQNENGTAMIISALHSCPSLVPKIIEKGADVNVKDDDGDTLLMLAVLFEKVDIVKLLLEKGADVWMKNNLGKTPLHFAKSASMAQMLIDSLPKRTTDYNTSREKYVIEKDKDGNTALFYAVNHENIEMIDLLFHYGAVLYSQNNNGQTPLHTAATKNIEVFKKLLERMPEPEADEISLKMLDILQDIAGQTPLHYAASYGQCEIGCAIRDRVKLEGGWELFEELVQIQNKDGNTASHVWLLSKNHKKDFNAIRTCVCFDTDNLAGELKNNKGMTPNDLYKQRYKEYTDKEKCHVSKWRTVEDMSSDQFYIQNIAGFNNLIVLPWAQCSNLRYDIESIKTSVDLDGFFPANMQRPLSESLLDCYRASLYPQLNDTRLSDLAKACNGKWF